MKIALQTLSILLALCISSSSFADVSTPVHQEKKIYYKGTDQKKRVALTFDDGPDDIITVKVLDILKKEHVHASFFVVGRLVKHNSQIFKRIVKEGHLVAIHAWTHPDLTKLTSDEIKSQLHQTSSIIHQYSGKKPLLFRPPYGALNEKVKQVVQNEGLTTIQWNIDTKDWQGPSPTRIVGRISSQIVPGSIILQHSAGGTRRLESTVDALPEIIRLLKQQGYQIVTLDELLHTPAYSN